MRLFLNSKIQEKKNNKKAKQVMNNLKVSYCPIINET